MILGWLRNRRRRKLLAHPPPEHWLQIAQEYFTYWRRLDDDERSRLMGIARILIAEKYWEGSGGLVLTDEMKVSIALQAALLLLNIEHDYYSQVQTILVYPRGYFSGPSRQGPGGLLVSENTPVSGQAHYRGPIILSWHDVRRGAINDADGRNLVYHEFAHKLDMIGGVIDGTPPLADPELRRSWGTVMSLTYQQLQHDLAQGKRTFLRPYAATNEAEFFAVCTEQFFEMPMQMQQVHPAVYELLSAFYKQDPAARLQ